MDIAEQISRNVAAALLKADRSQAAAARAIGISESAFRRKLARRGEFYPSELMKLADFLHIEIGELLPTAFQAVA